MSIDRLQYFAAVVETKNLRQAAELVGISPPSMSKAIAVLEAELQCKLLYPDGRGIGITPRGMEVYRLCSSLLEEHRKFFLRLKEGENRSPRLRMATFEVFSTYFVSSFLQQEKDYDLLLLEMTPGKVEQAILAGTVEFGITYLPSPDPTLEYVQIGAFSMGIYGRKEWADKAFSDWPFAVPTTELKIHSSEIDSLDLWPPKAAKRKIKYNFELLETALQTSRQGLSVLHCPDFIVQLHNEFAKSSHQLVSLSPPQGYKAGKQINVYLVARKGNAANSKLERKLAKFMRTLAHP